MKIEKGPQKFSGQVKFTRGLSGKESCPKYRTGSVVLTQKDKGWILEVHLDVSENAVLCLMLTPDSLLRTSFGGEFFMIKAYLSPTSKETVTVTFKPDSKYVIKSLKTLDEEFKSHRTQGTKSEVGLSSSNTLTTPSRKALFTTVGNAAENARKEVKTENRHQNSAQRFTSVKENKCHASDDIDGDFKENMLSTPDRSGNEKLLQRGIEKSRQSLSSFEANHFYSGSTPQQTTYNGSGWLNSAKRQPGMMPNPTPSKRPRLSDSIPYSMKARTVTEDHKQQQPLQGFSNLGNTCYMNAILQSLFGLDTLTADLLITNRRLLKTKTISAQSLYWALAKLLNSRKQNLPDVSRREMLRKVKGAISASAKRFSGYGQHDAHEFLGQVLDQLKEEVVKINKSTPSPVREPMTENGLLEMDCVNPATVNFEFEIMHTITCLQCREEVSKEEQFHDVSVDLPKKKDATTPRSLQDSLSIFFRKEEIEYTCEKCGQNKSEVTHKFTRLPRVFIIHLKRYSYDQTFLKNTKMAQSVTIPTYLTLQSHCEENTQPAHPVQIQHVNHSKEKALTIFDVKEETPKRKLDFPVFNKKGLTPSTVNGNSTGPETGNLDKDKTQEEAQVLKPLTLEDEHDSELAKAIEMSLKEQEEREQFSRDYGDDSESSFQKVLELSRQEEEQEERPTEKQLENLSDEQLLQLAIEQSLMENDPNHPDNCSYNDDVIKTSGDHDYAGSYDIGPELEDRKNFQKKRMKTEHNSNTSQIEVDSFNFSSSSKTPETSDTLKICSEAVMSSNSERAVSPGVFSDSESDPEMVELFHEPDQSQELTKIEDKRNKVENKDKNNNFRMNEAGESSIYFSKGKTGRISVQSTARRHECGTSSNIIKLPGGKKETESHLQKKENLNHDDSLSTTGSSDTDDFELTIETESEYRSSISTWHNKSLKSYDKLGRKNSNSENMNFEKNRSHSDLKMNENDLDVKAKKEEITILKGQSRDPLTKTKLSYSSSFSARTNPEDSNKESISKLDSSGQYVRKCQLGTKKNIIEVGKDCVEENVIEIDSDDDDKKIKSENTVNEFDKLKENRCLTSVTPGRRHYRQKLEDLGKEMNENSDSVTELMKESPGAKLLEKIDNMTDGSIEKAENVTEKGTEENTGRKNVDQDIYDFECTEDDSWMLSVDDKENKHPLKERPVLTDPSDVFGDDKVTITDEVDGFIDANIDIPEINNEKGDLPYSYRLVSVVSHMGISSSTGHYISDVYDIKKRGWFSFDDSHVSKTTESEVRSKRERSGYIFFYMSKDIFDDLCLQHAVTTTERNKES